MVEAATVLMDRVESVTYCAVRLTYDRSPTCNVEHVAVLSIRAFTETVRGSPDAAVVERVCSAIVSTAMDPVEICEVVRLSRARFVVLVARDDVVVPLM